MSSCKTCELVKQRDDPDAPLWDTIHRTAFFDVAHAYDTSLPGWTVIVARRHVESIDDLSIDEAAQLGPLIHAISKGLKEAVGCSKTYVMQFAEHEGHNHVHFHIVPRDPHLPGEHKGANIFHYLGVDVSERVSESAMNEIATVIRRHVTGR